MKTFLKILFFFFLVTQICFAQWVQTNGPYGGSVTDLGLSGNNIFAGTGGGVFLSTDNGSNWNAVNNGLLQLTVYSLTISGDNIFAGTDGAGAGGGVWRRPLSEMITAVETNKDNLPTEFALEQNYPTPFNPSTKISWQLPIGIQATLKVYDVLGKEVATLVNEYKPAGTYELTWNAANLPSGVYFYRIKAGSFIQTRKMILLK